MEEAWAYQRSAVLFAAVEVGLFDALSSSGPADAAALARAMACSERGITRLADALAALGWLEKDGGRYRLDPGLALLLAAGSPQSLRPILRHHGRLFARWSQLAGCVREGAPVARERSFEAHHEFLMAMDALAVRRVAQLWSVVRLDGCSRLLDVGGGAGRFALEAVRRFPGLEAVVVDLPESERPFATLVAGTPEADRVRFVAADAIAGPLPEGDAALVSSLVHIYGKEELERLAASLAAALAPGSLLVIRDFFFADADHTRPASTALFAVNMLVNTETGGCYSAAELESIFGPAGFTRWELRPLDARMSVLTAVLGPGEGEVHRE